jgi:RHS repeat-associated protein
MAGRVVEATVGGDTRELRRFGGRIESGLTTLGTLDLGAVAIHVVTGERWYRHADFRGQVSFVSDAAGEVVAHHRYRPFALDATFGASPGGTSFERQPAFGPLVMMGARMFDPLIGRFLSPDPVFAWVNAYAYAAGNPLWWEDRDGLTMSMRARIELGLKVAQAVAALMVLVAVSVAAPPVAISAIGWAATVGTGIVTTALLIDAGITALQGVPAGVQPSPPAPAPPGPNPGKNAPSQHKEITLTVEIPASPSTCSPLDVSGHARTPYAALCLILLVNVFAGAVWWSRKKEGNGWRRRT